MNKYFLMLLWPPAVFMTWPPAYCGGEQSKPLTRQDASLNIILEIQNSNAEITSEDAKVKRTDIKKLFASEQISGAIRLNGEAALCDVDGCGQPATNFWVDSEAGCYSYRCDKHK